MSTIFDKWKQSLSNLKNNITTGVQNAKSKLGTWLDSLKASQKSQTATTTTADASTTTPMSQEANVGLPNPDTQKPNIAPMKQDVATIQAEQLTTAPETPQKQSDSFLDWYKSKYGSDYNGSFNRAEGCQTKIMKLEIIFIKVIFNNKILKINMTLQIKLWILLKQHKGKKQVS